MSIRLAIFDLGEVVIEIDWGRAHAVWARYSGQPVEQLAVVDLDDEVHFAYERGEITDERFCDHVNVRLGTDLTFAQFAEGWTAIYGGVYAEVAAALRALSVPAVAFTNTNALHEPAWMGRFSNTLARFDRVYISSRMGCRKPEAAGFERILGEWGVRPEQALFFDDVAENVAAARALGIRGVVVTCPADVVSGLRRAGL